MHKLSRFAGLLAGCCILAAQASPLKQSGRFDPFASSEPYTKRILELANAERAKSGLEPLVMNQTLMVSARWHALDMATGNYFDHKDRLGRGIGERAHGFGYDYTTVGQNIAAGQKTAEEAFQEWMDSPGHRADILRPEFKETGIAFVQSPGSKFKRYWVQDFGTRDPKGR